MAQAGIRVDETIPCAVSGAGEALDRLLAAVASGGEYQAVQVSSDRLQFARTFRPTWAIVAGCLTFWVALLGVLFFFVKTTETCLAVVESDHRGTRVRLVGRLHTATLGRVRAALTADATMSPAPVVPPIGQPVPTAFGPEPAASGGLNGFPEPRPGPANRPPAPKPAPSMAPPPFMPAPVTPTGAPSTAPPPFMPAPAAPSPFPAPLPHPAPTPAPPASAPTVSIGAPTAPASGNDIQIPTPPAAGSTLGGAGSRVPMADPDMTIVHRRAGGPGVPPAGGPFALLDDGSRIELALRNLIGRDPEAGPGDGATQLLPIADPTRSVSKTHVEISFRDSDWWVTDLHSTNGVEVVHADGRTQRLLPGMPTAVSHGAQVRFGERSVQLCTGGGR